METLPGLIATFDRETIFHKDLSDLATVRSELIELTLECGTLIHLELTVSGYDDDPRSLYEVPEVNRWVRLAHKRWPDMLFWMTAGTLWPVVLCLNPEMHKREADGLLKVAMETEKVIEQVAESHIAAFHVLREGGMAEDVWDRVADRARRNVMDLFARKKLGDYVVIHPKTGEVLNYRRDRSPSREN